MKYFVYVLKSVNHPKSYVGHTDNLERRLNEHNSGKSEYTKKYRPWQLVYNELFSSEIEAVQREKYLKTTSGRRFLKNVVFV